MRFEFQRETNHLSLTNQYNPYMFCLLVKIHDGIDPLNIFFVKYLHTSIYTKNDKSKHVFYCIEIKETNLHVINIFSQFFIIAW